MGFDYGFQYNIICPHMIAYWDDVRPWVTSMINYLYSEAYKIYCGFQYDIIKML